MVKFYSIQNNTVTPAKPAESCISVYIAPTNDELEALKASGEIDEHTLSSALDPDEIPRLEIEPDHYSVIWKRPHKLAANGSLTFEVSSMGMFVFKQKMIIVLSEDVRLFEGRHFQRISGITDVFMRLISISIAHFQGHLKVIDSLSKEIKKKVNTSMENKYLLQMFELSESLVYYLNAIASNGTVLEKMKNSARKLELSPEGLEVLEDVLIDNGQCYKQADIFSSILTGLMDARGTVVNNNVNTLLKRLTIINTIFLPLNLIASIGGMSEYSAWTSKFPWEVSYLFFMLGMVIIGVIMYLLVTAISSQESIK